MYLKKMIAFLMLIIASATALTAQNVDEDYMKEIDKMLIATQAKQATIDMLSTTYQNMRLPLTSYTEAAEAVVDSFWDNYIEDYAIECMKFFTLEDLRNINAFYATPSGKKVATSYGTIGTNMANMVAQKYSYQIQQALKNFIKQ